MAQGKIDPFLKIHSELQCTYVQVKLTGVQIIEKLKLYTVEAPRLLLYNGHFVCPDGLKKLIINSLCNLFTTAAAAISDYNNHFPLSLS